MGCCIALAALIALVRRGWSALTGREPAPAAHFAPPARRPAPGGAVAVVAAAAPVQATGSHRQLGGTLVTAGLAWFAVGLVGMHVLGWFTWAEGSMLSDAAFHSSGLWLAAAGGAVLAVRA